MICKFYEIAYPNIENEEFLRHLRFAMIRKSYSTLLYDWNKLLNDKKEYSYLVYLNLINNEGYENLIQSKKMSVNNV